MNPNGKPIALTLAETVRLAGFLASRGYTDVASEMLTRATLEAVLAGLAEVDA